MCLDDSTELNPALCFILQFQIAYWEVFDGSVIRELDGSLSGAVNGMDITVEGVHFVTGQSWDQRIKPSLAYLNGNLEFPGRGATGVTPEGSKGQCG